MSAYDKVLKLIPSIAEPKTYLSFKSRIKWTGIILILFLVLGSITVIGAAPQDYSRFLFFELILGSKMGSILTLGIGPIVMASIILQLLVGSKIIPWDLKSPEGRARFQGTQKLLTIIFAIFEAYAYVAFGVVNPATPGFAGFALLVGQLTLGGILVLFMDDVISKWGIGSGVSLFIAAGVSKSIFIGIFNPCAAVPTASGTIGCGLPDPSAGILPFGAIPQFISYMQIGDMSQAVLALLPMFSTIIVFLVVIYMTAIRVDIPLAFTTIRGFGRRWPLKFIYTSNIPVILAGALLANLYLVGPLLARRGITILGEFDAQGQAISGLTYFLSIPQSTSVQVFSLVLVAVIFISAFAVFYFKLRDMKKVLIGSVIAGIILAYFVTSSFVGLPSSIDFVRMFTYLVFFVLFCTIFSVFWVNTSGMDADSVAEQIEGMGMQIPGFRRDPRIIREVLNRYIPILAILGGASLGLLAAAADFTNAIGTGTGILLTVMIIYNFYEIIAARYAEEVHPSLRGFFG